MPKGRPPQSYRAIVLQVRNVGEGHRIVDAWLLGQGRVGLWARHARSSKRRFGGALCPFAEVHITAVADDSLWHLETADLHSDRLGIRNSLEAIGRAATLVRVVQALWPTGDDADGMFDGLTVALDHLAAGRLPRAAGLYPRIASLAGLLPSMVRCGACEEPIGGEACAPQGEGLLLCRACAPEIMPLSSEVLAALSGARIENEAVAAVVETLVARWVSLFTGQKLTPWAVSLPTGPTSP